MARDNPLHTPPATPTFYDNVTNAAALGDSRRGDLCKTTTADTKLEVAWDQQAAPAAVTRLWLSGVFVSDGQAVTVSLVHDTDPDFAGAVELVPGASIPAGETGPVWFDTTVANSRYMRLTLSVTNAALISLGEMVVTEMRETTRGPEQGWRDDFESNRLAYQKESGSEYTIALGPDRRRIQYRYRVVTEAADHAVFETLWTTCGAYRPFLVDPAYDQTPGGSPQDPVWMKLDSDMRVSEDGPGRLQPWVQGSYDLDLLEALA